MAKNLNEKYGPIIKAELKMELVRRSPSASITYILISFLVALTSYGQEAFKTSISLLAYIATFASLARFFLSKKIIKQPELITSKLKAHNWLIIINATCWAMMTSLVFLGSPLNSTTFALAVLLTLAIGMGGISSLSPNRKIQNYFFSTNLLIPCAVYVAKNHNGAFDVASYIFPIMLFSAFLYVFNQSKQFYANLIHRHTSELLLKDERDHLQTVIDSIPGFLIYLDSSLSITYVTRNLDKKLGSSFKTGQSLTDILYELAEHVRGFQKSGKIYDTKELCLNTFAGDEWFLLSFYRTDQEEIIIVGAPVGELVKTRKELEERTMKAVSASKLAALGEVAAGAGHEINNPVAIIHGYLTEMKKMLQKEEFGSKKSFTERLEKAASTLLRIKKIIGGLRLLSRDAEDDPFDLTPLNSIIEDTLSLCQDKFTTHAIKFQVDTVPDVKFECRPTQVSQVLINLINNAYDAVEQADEKRVHVKFSVDSSWIKITVTDTGPGIPEEAMEKIFEPFYTTKEPGKGTGLGLSISRGIMDAHKGKISCENNKGAAFTLEFPIKRSATTAA